MPKSSKPSHHTNLGLVVALLAVWSLFTGLFGTDIMDAYRRHVADRVQNSIVRLVIHLEDGRHGVCTGFVIKPGIVMTAAHCTEDGPLTADDAPTQLKYQDKFYDLAVLSTATKRPALELGTTLVRGDHVVAIGYASGEDFLLQMSGTLLLNRARIQDDLSPCYIMNYIGIPGMSGGPIVDDQGRVVSVVSRGITGIACGMSPAIIQDFLYAAGV